MLKNYYHCPVCSVPHKAKCDGKLFWHRVGKVKCEGSGRLVAPELLKKYLVRKARNNYYPHRKADGYEDHGLGESILLGLEYDGPSLAEDSLTFGHQRDTFERL